MTFCDELDIETKDGTAHAWAYRPDIAPRPAILLYPDAFGVRPSMHDLALRLSGLGYLVLLPNVFYRTREIAPFDLKTAWSVPAERERLMALIQSLTPARVATDGAAYLDAIAAWRDARADRVGVIGYCMGGRMAFLTAGQHPDRVRAAATFHAGRLVADGPDSPHLLASRIRARLYLGVADGDPSCTPAHQGMIAQALGEAHVDYQIELYQGKRHGFAVPDHANGYDPDAAARHFSRLETFFREALS